MINSRLTSAVIVLLAAALPAAALIQPLKINFQGKLLDPATNSPKNGPINMSFSIYNVPSGGVALYTEPAAGYTAVQVANGVFSVQIGTSVALTRELFLGASAYLEVTVQGDSPMTPRQQLTMSPYAFTANQLSDVNEVRLIANATYSTFTAAGNFTIPGGLTASSGTFANGVTASSGTFSATGNTQYSIATSSGMLMNAGTLRISGSGVINAIGTGIITSTLTFNAIAQPSVSASGAGALYFDSTASQFEVSQNGGSWDVISGTRTEVMWVPTGVHPQVTGVGTLGSTANQARCVRYYITENFLVERMAFEVTTALAGGIADVGFYDDVTKALVVHTGGLSVASTGAKSTTGLNGFLQKGRMYRYCWCSSGTTAVARSVSATNLTNTLENLFLASPAEGTQNGACTAGVLPNTLGTIVTASVIPVLSVIANTTAP